MNRQFYDKSTFENFTINRHDFREFYCAAPYHDDTAVIFILKSHLVPQFTARIHAGERNAETAASDATRRWRHDHAPPACCFCAMAPCALGRGWVCV